MSGDFFGGEILAKMLKEEGVDTVFGIIDGTYYGFYSTLRKYKIKLITPRHEANAAHMAAAYARLTGRLGVCMASNGPGVANILPGLVVENAEGNRILCVTSCRRTGISYPDRTGVYQGFSQSKVIGAFAKLSLAVPSVDRIPELMRAALRGCFEGRPGLVHIDVPENIMNMKLEALPPTWKHETYRNTTPLVATDEAVSAAADMLVAAKIPVLHAGSGVVHALAYEELARVADLLKSIVTTSWSARGCFREDSELSLSITYMDLNHQLHNEADCVLILGSRIGEKDWWGKRPYWRNPFDQKVIQVDSDGAIIGLNKPVTLPIVADIKGFLIKLADALEARISSIDFGARQQIVARYALALREQREKLDKHLADKAKPMHSSHVGHIASKVFPDDAVFVADGGNTTVWASMYHEVVRPGGLLSTFKFGMLGAGIPQALGAAVATGGPVCCIIGDGAFGMHPQEVETAIRNKLQVIFIVLADKQWGMVKLTQQVTMKPLKTIILKTLKPEENINTDLGEIEWDKLGESMGAYGERVNDPKKLAGAIERALDTGRCSVIHVDVDPAKHLWVPGLKYFKDMHQEPSGK